MDTISLAKELQGSSVCQGASLWTSRYLEMVAAETLRLSWQLDDFTAELREHYWEALADALTTLPSPSKIRVTLGLREHLEEKVRALNSTSNLQDDLIELIERRTYAMPLA